MINSCLFGVRSPAWAHPAIEGSALLGVAIRCSQLEARLFELSLHFTWSSHAVSATTVCSTALLETTKGTAAKVIGRCKAKSPKEVLWNPLDIECVANFL